MTKPNNPRRASIARFLQYLAELSSELDWLRAHLTGGGLDAGDKWFRATVALESMRTVAKIELDVPSRPPPAPSMVERLAGADSKAGTCVCGRTEILADTEDWRAPLCLTCWLRLGAPEWEPRPMLRRVLRVEHSASEHFTAVQFASCEHVVLALTPENGEAAVDGCAWPCVLCLVDEIKAAAS